MPDSPRIVRRNGWSLGWLAVAFGVTIVGCHVESGRRRWSAAAWQFAAQVPGSPATWGVIVLVAGVLILLGCRQRSLRWRLVGCWLACLWFCALAAAAGIALVHDLFDNVVNPLSIIAWLCIAFMYRLHIRDEKDYAQPQA